MKIPHDLRFTENDEWIRVEGDTGTVGLSDYAQDQLSDVVFVDVSAAPGSQVTKGDSFASVESVKAAADVYMPVDGEIVEANKDLVAKPETVNIDPYGQGWLAKIKILDAGQVEKLMDAAAYEKFCQERST